MNVLHINLNEFTNASRVIKQCRSIGSLNYIDTIYVAAIHGNELERCEQIGENIFLNRFELWSRSLGKSAIWQLLKYIEFSLRILLFYRKKQIGIVNVHSVKSLPIGHLFKLLTGAKLVYDTHELETETDDLVGARKKVVKYIEHFYIRKVNHIFVVGQKIADWYADEYGIARPTVVLNSPKLTRVKKNNYIRTKYGLRKDQKVFLYQGLIDCGRGIENLLAAFKARDGDNAVIVLMGYGPLADLAVEASSTTRNIFFHKAVPPDELLDITASADVGLAIIPDTCLSYSYCLPNKLFEYVMSGIPVISSNLEEMASFIEKYKIGFIVEEQSITAINIAIDTICEANLAAFKKDTYVAAVENSWEIQEVKMLGAYNDLMGMNN
jgi:glycosyltransferase involved in cell wall biosynthesis